MVEIIFFNMNHSKLITVFLKIYFNFSCLSWVSTSSRILLEKLTVCSAGQVSCPLLNLKSSLLHSHVSWSGLYLEPDEQICTFVLYLVMGVHFKMQLKFHFVIPQYNETWNAVHKRCWRCPPFSCMQAFTRFTRFCATRWRILWFMLAVAFEMLPFPPAQYANTRMFSTLLTGQLHEVL
jgi:hypothetical protein